jgi:hypothetical protein
MGSTIVRSDDPGHVPRGIATSWCDYLAHARVIKSRSPIRCANADINKHDKQGKKKKTRGRTAVSTSRVPVLPYDTPRRTLSPRHESRETDALGRFVPQLGHDYTPFDHPLPLTPRGGLGQARPYPRRRIRKNTHVLFDPALAEKLACPWVNVRTRRRVKKGDRGEEELWGCVSRELSEDCAGRKYGIEIRTRAMVMAKKEREKREIMVCQRMEVCGEIGTQGTNICGPHVTRRFKNSTCIRSGTYAIDHRTTLVLCRQWKTGQAL